MGFTYKGIHSSTFGLAVQPEVDSILPPLRTISLDVPRKHGSYYIGTKREMKAIYVPVGYFSPTKQDHYQRKRNIAGWLNPDDNTPGPLIFDDDPDVVYFAVVDGVTELDRTARIRTTIITFLCPDTVAYDNAEQQVQFDANGQLTILNDGTAETYPSFSIAFNQPTTYLHIVNLTTDETLELGFPAEVEDIEIDPQELVYQDSLTSTSDWVAGQQLEQNRYVGGQMGADSNGFYPAEFGERDSGWQGPALQRVLPQELQDFRVDVRMSLQNGVGLLGRMEVYLVDANQNILGRIGLRDAMQTRARNVGFARVGYIGQDPDGLLFETDNEQRWNAFDGLVRFERVGNQWTAYIAQIGSLGRHMYAVYETRSFTMSALQAPLARIQLYMAASFRDGQMLPPAGMRMRELRVYKLNQTEDTGNVDSRQVPLIAHQGDVITVDNGLNLVLRNGEPLNQIIALKNKFFALERGTNHLEVFPKNIATVTMNWRRRWV